MNKRILDSRLPALAYNPTGVFDISYFEACHSAGILPVYDTEFFTDEEIFVNAGLLASSDIIAGIRINGERSSVVKYIREKAITNLDVVILYFHGEIPQSFEDPGINCKIILEVVGYHKDSELKRVDPHAIIIRGYEAGGRASRFTSYILMQWFLENSDYPVFVHGGVGFHTAPGIFAAGCAGVVLDSQLYLTDEAPLSENYKKLMTTVEEGDSTMLGESLEYCFHFFSKLGTKITKDLKIEESQLFHKENCRELFYERISSLITKYNDASANTMQSLVYLGQDGLFAKMFAQRSKKLAEVIKMFFENIGDALKLVDDFDPMKENTALAKEHNTRYPVIQGPMANISDNAEFAKQVYDAGSLPFFAMGNLPEDLFEKIVSDGKAKLDNFGCGLIGLPALNKRFPIHISLLKKYKVPYALIAAGYPAQANELEADGVKTYLHCPSSHMLENAIQSGVKRFIFEGMEAGGHIGTLTSFVLWEAAVEKFLAQKNGALESQSIIFAGGIGTKTGSNFISGMTSVLAAQGASVGISAGTAYLFTEEIIKTGAMKELYQKLLLEKDDTVIIGGTLGLSTRTIHSPNSTRIFENEYENIKSKVPLNERKFNFEQNNLGTLLIAAKAFSPNFEKLKTEGVLEYINYTDDEVYDKGNFQTGEALSFYNQPMTIEQVHSLFFGWKKTLRKNLNNMEIIYSGKNIIHDEIAIIGIGCLYPDAPDADTYWKNTIEKKYSIREIPNERLNHGFYYNPDKKADDKTYTKIAGFVDYFEFDYAKYGFKETEAKHISRSQKMVLETAVQAVADAGYMGGEKQLPKEKTAVIIGSCLTNEYNSDLQLRQHYPEFIWHLDQIDEYAKLSDEEKQKFLVHFKDKMSAGYTPKDPVGAALNVEASRIAKYFNLEGINYTIDAACATSFAAIDAATKELLTGESDVVIVGGVNTNHSPEAFVGFAKMGALSADGSYPFDERANGFVLGEGSGVILMKRMKDAIADGDKIYAVIKGVGASSDGKGKFIAAPSKTGQTYAIERAYENMLNPITPDDIDFIEAHGTSTGAGDSTEMETLKGVYNLKRPKAVSSAKSMIGHLLGGAGNAGLIRALLAIKNKTLPPNGQFEKLSSKLTIQDTPIKVVKDAAPWNVEQGRKRRAAVSSYGFGGINYHMIIEEYDGDYTPVRRSIFNDVNYDYNDDRIVVAGIGVVMPGAQSSAALWDNLVSGKKTISDTPNARFHNEYYAKQDDPSFNIPMIRAGRADDFQFNGLKYKMPPSTMKSIDRGQFFSLDAANQVIEEAKLQDKLVPGNKIAAVIGTTSGEKNVHQIIRTRIPLLKSYIEGYSGFDKELLKKISDKFEEQIKELYWKNTEDTIPGLLANIVTGRIANFFNCNGANYVIDGECASSAIALNAAIKDLKFGTSDYIIAGGVDANISIPVITSFNLIKIISPADARIFDKDSSGMIMSEGASLMCLTTYKKAKEDKLNIYGELTGFSLKSATGNLLAPTETGLVNILNEYYSAQPISRRQVRYIDAFASSNKIVDKWELTAMQKSYEHKIYMGNVKTDFGYYRAANPAMVIAKLALMAHNRSILPAHGYHKETSLIEADSNVQPLTEGILSIPEYESLIMAANFSGLGGIIGHGGVKTLPLWMNRGVSKAVPSSMAAVSSASAGPISIPAAAVAKSSGKTLVLLSGQGAQYSGMMKQLYASNSEIKKILDRGEELFKQARGYSILDMMFGNDAKINSTENTQPAIFLSSASIYSYLASKGFSPDLFIGHSIGEYTALYTAGIVSFDDAMKIIIKRSEIMKEAAEEVKGAIMVVFLGADETDSHIKKSGVQGAWVANKNSDKQTAVSGTSDGIDKISAYFTSQNVRFMKLNLSGAFHSPLFAGAGAKMESFLKDIKFNEADYSKIISNVTAKRYPSSEADVKSLLVKQISSPVEFVNSLKTAVNEGAVNIIEIGPNKLLTNLLKDISVSFNQSLVSVDPKVGEIESFNKFISSMEASNMFTSSKGISADRVTFYKEAASAPAGAAKYTDSADFNEFVKNNQSELNKVMYAEFEKFRNERNNEFFKRAGFYGGPVVISGTAVGLPGKSNKVFEDDNFDKLLKGMNLIDPIEENIRKKIVDRNIVRVHKDSQGNAKFVEINSTEEVIQLAGQLGYFDKKDYGIEFDHDPTVSLAIAAGIEALKDAGIPLVTQHETTTIGGTMEKGYALPPEMQEGTGVIFTTQWGSLETLLNDYGKFAGDKFYQTVHAEFENLFHFIMTNEKEDRIKRDVTDWYVKVKNLVGERDHYSFNRSILYNILIMGNAHFAQMIKAKGPNMQSNAACASTTQAIGIADDWIRTGRCDRVIIISGEASTTNTVLPLIGAGFLALGAATVKRTVGEAVKPFDADRNGLILGSAAIALIVERQDSARERGQNGQAEILGVHIKNSAFHGTRLNVNHVSAEMKNFIGKMEYVHGLNRSEFSSKLLFMSHETYTPARGGSADAEVFALKNAFPDDYSKITISNTKGFTGHTLSAGIEDPVLVKALLKGMAPTIANLKKIPENFADLKFSKGERGDYEYGIHFSAGFGSQFAILFVRRLEENRFAGNDIYKKWLEKITHINNPEPMIINNALCIKASVTTGVSQAAVSKVPTSSAAVSKPVPAKTVMVPAAVPAVNFMGDIKKTIAGMTGYGEDMLDPELDLEADLGIDTVKQVEIFGKLCEQFGVPVPEDIKLTELNTIKKLTDYIAIKSGGGAAPSAVTAPSAVGGALLMGGIKKTISDMTGYGEDMLDSDLDLEADLGIDTVKQVEIFGKLCEQYGIPVPEDIKLTELNTIQKLADYIASKTGAVTTAAVYVQPGASADFSGDIKRIISEMTGYGEDMLDSNLDLEADLGIDTVKQVEIFGKLCEHFGISVPEDIKLTELNTIDKISGFFAASKGVAAAAPASGHAAAVQGGGSSSIKADVKRIISEMTGYGDDMLDDGLDLEADLGIDTVKQVEIFGKLCEFFGVSVPEDIKLAELNNISKIAGFFAPSTGRTETQPATAASTGTRPGLSMPASSFIADVKRVISEMTGYGEDMLDDNLGLEADLGIDTVKQVEIFGKICENFGIAVPEDIKLTELNTISKIGDFLVQSKGGAESPVETTSVGTTRELSLREKSQETTSKSDDQSIKRFVVRPVIDEFPGVKGNIFKGKTVIMSLDSKGLGLKVKEKINALEGKVITLGSNADYNVDLSDADAVEKTVKDILAEESTIDGFIHLAPVTGFFSGKVDPGLINEYVKSMFITVRTLYKSLDRPGTLVASISFDSVIFPYIDPKAKVYPVYGAVSGMMKSINKELKNTLVKIVDFNYADPSKKFDEIADKFIAELNSGDTKVETGYSKKDERYRITIENIRPEVKDSFVKDGDVVIVSGGARGITFEILKEVMNNFKIKPVIIGLSDISNINPDFLRKEADDKYLMNVLAAEMKGAKPLDIKRAVGRVRGEIDTYNNLKTLEGYGAQIEYYAVDVTDAKRMKEVISKYDKIDGIIHAAGFEESQPMEKKDLKTFNAVFDTKINGALNIIEAVEGKAYRYFIGFSSVSARFGNEAQTDYSAANEMLTRLLQAQKRRFSDRTFKIYDWTGWGEVGMATKESVMKVLSSLGMKLMPVKTGVGMFMADLYDTRDEEVVVTNVMPAFDIDGIMTIKNPGDGSPETPFLGEVLEEKPGYKKFQRILDLRNDGWLLDHEREGVPLFLGATGIETMSEAAQAVAGKSKWLLERKDFTIPYSIKILKGKPKELMIEATKVSDNEISGKIISQFMKDGKPMGNPTLHYQGQYVFADKKPSPVKVKIPELGKLTWEGRLGDLLYHPKRLFMDNLFRSISDVICADRTTVVSVIHNKWTGQFFKNFKNPAFVTDPVVVDAIFQTGGLVEFIVGNEIILPFRIGKMTFYREIKTNDEYVCITRLVKRDDKEKLRHFDVDLCDRDGNLFLHIDNYTMIAVEKVPADYDVSAKFKLS
jgi:malonyl CoA-acyl carrier protein transacylase